MTIFFLCRLDNRFGGCACSGGGGGATGSWILPIQEKKLKPIKLADKQIKKWILPLQEKKLNLSESHVLDSVALT